MRNLNKIFLLLIFVAFTAFAFGQTSITGTVTNKDDGSTLPGVTVVVKGTTVGTVTDMNGKYSIEAPAGAQFLVFSYIGFETQEIQIVSGTINVSMVVHSSELSEIVIIGVADIAKDRRTPVSVSTMMASDIENVIGTKELPEVLNFTPSVYATKSGGAFGDSRINIRGFDQRNTAVMINGMPVNDMENGWVYWSNWAGLSDVTTAMQVQRGLGSSKLAISSVGGTINIITKATENEQGGSVTALYGHDNYLKTVASYSTGKFENGFAASLLFGRTAGNGYVQGTSFEGYNYYLALGYDKGGHNLQLTVTGAPQIHNQRTTSFYNMATLENYEEYGHTYNYNHGELDGEEFNWRKNFYHKPIASLNWDWKFNKKSKLATVLYASVGRGGGTGDIGVGDGYGFASSSRYRNPTTGEVDWDRIVSLNSGEAVTFYDDNTYQITPTDGKNIISNWGDGLVRRASMNSHNWFGMISNFNHKLTDNLTFDVGIDLRSYKGIHYRRLDNLLGADGYIDNDDINNPDRILTNTYSSDLGSLWNVFKSVEDEEKIDYYNDGLVNWMGAFTQLEYSNGTISAFIQGAVSRQGYKRIDYFNYEPAEQESDWENILGGNIKGGANYNINEFHNIFVNAGYYSKQPLFDGVWINYVNDLNEDYRNEKILGFEAGYGLRTKYLRANLNLYRTSWKDRFITIEKSFDVNNTPGDDSDDVEGIGNLSGVEQVHIGVEFDAEYRLSTMLRVNAMLSVGNWEYAGDVTGSFFDDNQVLLGEGTLYLDGVKVGDAAQMTGALGVIVTPVKGLSINVNGRHANILYANISAEDFDDPDHKGSLELPSFTLMDAGIRYKFTFGKDLALSLMFNMNNVLDTEYISESITNYHEEDDVDNYAEINQENKAFFGWGRTWNVGLKFDF
ncbi:MAG: TonB-dependent receptor [Bacteroidales bacterium]|nr:TonB-dependent receptor [Bacteroidales bacterium]